MIEGSNKEHRESPSLLERTAAFILAFAGAAIACKILFSLFWLSVPLWIFVRSDYPPIIFMIIALVVAIGGAIIVFKKLYAILRDFKRFKL